MAKELIAVRFDKGTKNRIQKVNKSEYHCQTVSKYITDCVLDDLDRIELVIKSRKKGVRHG